MLMQLGAVQFAVAPFNADSTDQTTGSHFAAHPVIGAMPPQEFTGEATEEYEIRGKLFPQRFGGLDGLEAMQAMSRSGDSYFLMRGDGRPMGWYVVKSLRVHSSYLDGGGVGRVIEFSIRLDAAQSPSADGIFWSLFGQFL